MVGEGDTGGLTQHGWRGRCWRLDTGLDMVGMATLADGHRMVGVGDADGWTLDRTLLERATLADGQCIVGEDDAGRWTLHGWKG